MSKSDFVIKIEEIVDTLTWLGVNHTNSLMRAGFGTDDYDARTKKLISLTNELSKCKDCVIIDVTKLAKNKSLKSRAKTMKKLLDTIDSIK